MKSVRLLFISVLLISFFSFAQENQSSENSYPKFIPYSFEQDTIKHNFTIVELYELGNEQPARWLSVDPLADKYPGWSPYNYCLNNPLRNIDPDGKDVKSSDQEHLKQLAGRLNHLFQGANISVISVENEEGMYALATDIESEFDWGQNEFTSALFDAIHSADVTFNVVFSDRYKGDREFLAKANNLEGALVGKDLGGGYTDPRYGGATIWIARNENEINTKNFGIVFMHEALGHGHPVGGNDARVMENTFYGNTLGSKHGGYLNEIGWKQTGLWNYLQRIKK